MLEPALMGAAAFLEQPACRVRAEGGVGWCRVPAEVADVKNGRDCGLSRSR